MTDLTILIAVIALALWPLAFLVLRIRHERKKRRDRLDRMTKEDLEDIHTDRRPPRIPYHDEPGLILYRNIKIITLIFKDNMSFLIVAACIFSSSHPS